ncbi:MAG: Hpt domain-containing protein [Lentisphaerales bacterium]|nr:Hpt domain-containing protein [Lentisphaerales bacterium]
MEDRLNILQNLKSHISSTLTKIKLEKLGHSVKESHVFENMRSELTVHDFDLILLDASITEETLYKNKLKGLDTPVLYIETDHGVCYELDQRFLLKSTFEEEDFLHKFQYAEDYIKKSGEEGLSLKETIFQHYAGDEILVAKVSATFLGGYAGHLEKIKTSFKEGTDDELAKKFHAFKGTLSALGETPAAKLVRKMEILIKARQRQIAKNFYEELKKECSLIAAELEAIRT